MTYITFELYGLPAAKGSVSAFPFKGKDGKMHVNISHGKKSKDWENAIKERVKEFEPLQGPLGVSLNFWLTKGKTVKREWPTTKPDIDKLTRAVLDGLKHVLGDDKNVCALQVNKTYGPLPGVRVSIWEITPLTET